MAREKPDREDIKAAIRKTGITCKGLSLKHGFSPSAVSHALVEPCLGVERVIAAHLKEHPATLWPDRYGQDGKPTQGTTGRRRGRTGAAKAARGIDQGARA